MRVTSTKTLPEKISQIELSPAAPNELLKVGTIPMAGRHIRFSSAKTPAAEPKGLNAQPAIVKMQWL